MAMQENHSIQASCLQIASSSVLSVLYITLSVLMETKKVSLTHDIQFQLLQLGKLEETASDGS